MNLPVSMNPEDYGTVELTNIILNKKDDKIFPIPFSKGKERYIVITVILLINTIVKDLVERNPFDKLSNLS